MTPVWVTNHDQLPLITRDYFNRLHDQDEIANYSAQIQQMRAQHPDWAQAADDAPNGDYSYMDSTGKSTPWLDKYNAAKTSLSKFTAAGKPGTLLFQLDDNGNSVSVALPEGGQIPANATVGKPETEPESGPGAWDVGAAVLPGIMTAGWDARIAQERNRLEANHLPVPAWEEEIKVGGVTVGGSRAGAAGNGVFMTGIGVMADMVGDHNSFDRAMARETTAVAAFNLAQGVTMAGVAVVGDAAVTATTSLAGAEAGAALGSVVPGVGTALGFVFGAGAGYLASKWMNGYYHMPDQSNVVLPAEALQAPQQHATGGAVTGPGSSIGDKIPAYLSDGEFVVNAASASENRPLLQAINADPAYIAKYSQQMERVVAAALTKVRAIPNAGGEHVDQSMTVHISAYDVHEAFAKAKLWEQRRALTDF